MNKTKTRVLITEYDLGLMSKLRKHLDAQSWNEEHNCINEDILVYLELLDRVENNLKNGTQYFKRIPKNEQKWFDAECNNCGWYASSKYLLGGHPIADTGDYSDTYCPVCGAYC